ncbi:CbtB domain-containing protein [Neomegalonema sp.]|uniref:CbtB domain-containing protein n=1 Tax=Neomegalonema sp. TaxID=2039713 RepID=UPI002630FB49|nr:CbtB domain-containing protein [Neomegalonema sp.]MDD2868383.1 CbtB-domain containing protein [Neomegalonema sp.]
MTLSTPAERAGSATSSLGAILAAALLGAALIFTAGLAQSEALHDAAHDVRHATGFPCH